MINAERQWEEEKKGPVWASEIVQMVSHVRVQVNFFSSVIMYSTRTNWRRSVCIAQNLSMNRLSFRLMLALKFLAFRLTNSILFLVFVCDFKRKITNQTTKISHLNFINILFFFRWHWIRWLIMYRNKSTFLLNQFVNDMNFWTLVPLLIEI